MSVPSRSAKDAPNPGQTPETFTPYPRPARPSLPPPSAELARQVANNASSGRMSVAAAFTETVPVTKRELTADGGVESDELSPQSVVLIAFPGAGNVLTFMVQCGWAKKQRSPTPESTLM